MKQVLFMFLIVVIGCSNKEKNNLPTAFKIDGKSYSKNDFNDFCAMRLRFPIVNQNEFFPGGRPDQSIFIETEILKNEIKKHKKAIRKIKDFELLDLAFKGRLYQFSIIQRRMGFTDKEEEAYYNKRREENPYAFGGATDNFSIRQLEVADSLFLATYPPDTEELSGLHGDEEAVRTIWLNTVKKDMAGFFIKEFYKEYYGQDALLSYDEVVNKLKIVTNKEIEIVKNWYPKKRQEKYGSKYNWIITRRILGWKLFNKKIEERKEVQEQLDIRNSLKWFDKYSYAYFYVNRILYPEMLKKCSDISIDTSVLKYSIYDESDSVLDDISDTKLSSEMYKYKKIYAGDLIYKKFRELRNKMDVQISDKVLKDEFVESSDRLWKEADSIASKTTSYSVALYKYWIISTYFATDPGSVESYRRIGDLEYKLGEFDKSIAAYRNYLLRKKTISDIDNIYFNIGNAYMIEKKYDLARLNFKWILANEPDSKLVGDVEFLVTHMGDPDYSDAVELRNEALRRGVK